MRLTETDAVTDPMRIRWLVSVHLIFVVCGLFFSLANCVAERVEKH